MQGIILKKVTIMRLRKCFIEFRKWSRVFSFFLNPGFLNLTKRQVSKS